jgi:hypothetical protein
MRDSKQLLQAIRDGQREFRREDYPTAEAFEGIVKEMALADELGFIKGHRVYRGKSHGGTIIKVVASHGLADEGMDYLIRIGG